VDASGKATFPDGSVKTYQSAKELIPMLAVSDDVRHCVANQWLRFALARREMDADAESVRQVYDAFARANFDVRELLLAITQARSFLFRAPAVGEVL
jgi:hypothetical protein